MELGKKEATETSEINFEGGRIVDNKELDRAQIFFHQKGIDPDISREDFASKFLKGENIETQIKHNAAWDANVIRYCYQKLST